MHRVTEAYGEHERQFGEWFLPDEQGAPLIVIIHGGYFRPVWRLDIENANAMDLCSRGFAVWSIEYRAYDQPWPATFVDVAAAIDYGWSQAPRHGIDTSRTALLGHSAGGALALWAASRRSLAAGAPGADPAAPAFTAVICHAPVACLALASRDHLGDGAIDTLMGGRPEDVPARYAACDPANHTPAPDSHLYLLHGDADEDVPLAQSITYVEHLQRQQVEGELILLPGEGHYEILDPTSSVSDVRRHILNRELSC